MAWPLFLVGLAGVARLWRCRRDAAHALILLALPVFLVPPLVAVEGGSPHFLRVLGIAAPLGATIGLGALELAERLGARWGAAGRRAAILGVAACPAVAAVLGAQLYASRPAAELYWPYRYDLSALAAAAGPGQAVVAGADDATTVRFLDQARLPAILAPGVRAADPRAYGRVLSLRQSDLAAVLGASTAARAVPIAWDPSGFAVVWAVSP